MLHFLLFMNLTIMKQFTIQNNKLSYIICISIQRD